MKSPPIVSVPPTMQLRSLYTLASCFKSSNIFHLPRFGLVFHFAAGIVSCKYSFHGFDSTDGPDDCEHALAKS
jgi:hypothetical protein